jgi:DNA-binding NarL/FixJ family response regulator
LRDGVIRVVLVDDHAVVRAGLKAVLGSAKEIEVIGEGSTG